MCFFVVGPLPTNTCRAPLKLQHFSGDKKLGLRVVFVCSGGNVPSTEPEGPHLPRNSSTSTKCRIRCVWNPVFVQAVFIPETEVRRFRGVEGMRVPERREGDCRGAISASRTHWKQDNCPVHEPAFQLARTSISRTQRGRAVTTAVTAQTSGLWTFCSRSHGRYRAKGPAW